MVFGKINIREKSLVRLIKNKREKTQINKIINEIGGITTDITGVQRIIQNYDEQLYT